MDVDCEIVPYSHIRNTVYGMNPSISVLFLTSLSFPAMEILHMLEHVVLRSTWPVGLKIFHALLTN